MDPLICYLVVINAVAFLAFVVDFLLCMRRPELENTSANSLILDVFPVIGGPLGMLLALFVLTGLGRGHRMNKDNIAWWFLGIACLIVWVLVVATRCGALPPDASIGGVFEGWRPDRLKVLGIYLLVINLVTFVSFTWDKHVAASGNDFRRRAPEARLLGLSLIGGSVGGLLAMHMARHKTRKWYFNWGLPCFILLDVTVILYAHMAGLI